MTIQNRTVAREYAYQFLFRFFNRQESFNMSLLPSQISEFDDSLNENKLNENLKDYANKVIKGVAVQFEQIETIVGPYLKSTSWKKVHHSDQVALAIGLYELQSEKDIPAAVVINEAVELAKKYGEKRSGSFVNGVLDNLAKKLRSH